MTRMYLFRLIACELAATGASHWSPLTTSEGGTTALWVVSLVTGLATLGWVTAQGITSGHAETFSV